MSTKPAECAKDQQPTLCDLELYHSYPALLKEILRLWADASKEECVNPDAWVDVTARLTAFSVALGSFKERSCSFELTFLFSIANERLRSAAHAKYSN